MNLQWTSYFEINVISLVSLPQHQYVFVFLQVPAHTATNFIDILMQIILLSVEKILNYYL
jgi:hypothetical protein